MQCGLWQGEGDVAAGKRNALADIASLSSASTAVDSPVSSNGSVASISVTSPKTLPSSLGSECEALVGDSRSPAHSRSTGDSRLEGFPRIVTPMQLLEESDDEIWCGPPSEPEDVGNASLRALKALGIRQENSNPKSFDLRTWGIKREIENPRLKDGSALAATIEARPTSLAADVVHGQVNKPHEKASLIQPPGAIEDQNNKYVCVFQIGLQDDQEFCLVKRILGKGGCNMRRIAEECNAKIRLRGLGSGFLEGSSGREANMPLQLNVSCNDYYSYKGAVDKLAVLLKDLYKHYRRYARGQGLEVPDVKVNLEEMRRDDLGFDVLEQKANRSASQRERDRQARRLQRNQEGERVQKNVPEFDISSVTSEITLPGGVPMPMTAEGRRCAAKKGGAVYGAIVSAAAREAEKQERERSRKERDEKRQKEMQYRDEKKREAAERAALVANRMGRRSDRTSQYQLKGLALQSARAADKQAPRSVESDSTLLRQQYVASSGGSESTSLCEEWDPWAHAAGKGGRRHTKNEQPLSLSRTQIYQLAQSTSTLDGKVRTYLI